MVWEWSYTYRKCFWSYVYANTMLLTYRILGVILTLSQGPDIYSIKQKIA